MVICDELVYRLCHKSCLVNMTETSTVSKKRKIF